jgi:hypothetical protein
MTCSDRLANFRAICRNYSTRKREGGFEFDFPIINQDSLDVLSQHVVKGVCDDTFQVGETVKDLRELSSKTFGQTVVAFSNTINWRSANEYVYENLADLLAFRPNRESIPETFYLKEEDYLHQCDEMPRQVKHYVEITRLVGHLISLADYSEKMTPVITNKVIFLHKSRLEIPIEYNCNDLSDGLDGLSVFESHLSESTHQEQKKSIIKEVLYGLLGNTATSDRLGYLVKHFGEFSTRFNENFQLFVSEFSFDKVRREFEEKKRDYMTKLDATFSELAGKLLSVPVAFFFAFNGIKPITTGADLIEISIQNTAMLFAVFLVSLYMHLLVKNQNHSLQAIKTEYSGLMDRLKHSYPDQFSHILKAKNDLDQRTRSLDSYFKISRCSVYCTLIFATTLWLSRFPNIRNIFHGLLLRLEHTLLSLLA